MTTLDIGNNPIGDVGAIAFSNILKNNNNLVQLNLSGNEISDDGAAAIAQSLTDNSKLTHMGLYNNKITDIGAEAIANALKEKNYTLKYLSLERNNFSKEILDNIFTYLKRNREQLVKSSYKNNYHPSLI